MSYTPESKAQLSASGVEKADTWEGDVLVLLAFQQEDKEAFAALAGEGAAAADKRLEGVAADMIFSQEFKVWGEGLGGLGAICRRKPDRLPVCLSDGARPSVWTADSYDWRLVAIGEEGRGEEGEHVRCLKEVTT